MSSFQTIDFAWGESPDPKIQPPMGFTLADRRAFLLQKRLDPVDLTLWSDPRRLPRTLAGRREDIEPWDMHAEDSTWGMDMTDPEATLVSSLLRAARGLRPDWQTYLFDYMGAYGILTGLEKNDWHPSGRSDRPRRKDVPAPNHTIGPILFAGEHADGVSIPLASRLIIDATLALGNPGDPRDFMDTLRKGEWREFPWGALLALSAQHFLQPNHAEETVRYDPPHIFVLNFQRTPSIMFDVLRRFRPPTPEDLAPPKGAQVSGPGAAR
jgi:hypothetical protein